MKGGGERERKKEGNDNMKQPQRTVGESMRISEPKQAIKELNKESKEHKTKNGWEQVASVGLFFNACCC